jgi:hypothetical protein
LRFFFSGEVDAEIADDYRSVRIFVAEALNRELGDADYGEVLKEIAIIPMILGPQFAKGREERRLVKRAERGADYRLFIDLYAWVAGSEPDRRGLLIANVLDCVADIDRKLKGGFDGVQMRQDILRIFPALGKDGSGRSGMDRW